MIVMKTVCELNQCTGCAVCVSKCPRKAISVVDNIKAYSAVIDENLCVNCGLCENVCPTNQPLEKYVPLFWKQGWAVEESIRAYASSGGVATALAIAFIKKGGIVCSCTVDKGQFVFDFEQSVKQVKRFIGSKYVKSNPDGIYSKVGSLLKSGRKVLFIGLPCQSAAIQSYTDCHESLYTVDLICHGTPSPKILQMFLREKGYNVESMRNIKFRQKTKFRISDGEKSIEPPSVFDKYTYAFLKGLCYTENCYSCQYAQISRVSDITLGDSWGSELSPEEQAKGISLVLCQSEKGKKLLEISALHLEAVDIEKAISNNQQLHMPSQKPKEYKQFYKTLMKTNNFSKTMNKCYQIVFFRQSVKAILIRTGIIGGDRLPR